MLLAYTATTNSTNPTVVYKNLLMQQSYNSLVLV